MSLESFIHFMITHNETIILVSVGLICLLSAIVVYLQVFGKKGMLKTGEKPDFDFSTVEESLKKILSQTQNTIQTVAAGGASVVSGATGAPASSGEVAALKKELEDRVKNIEELKAQVAAAKADDGSAEMLAKIKTLEGKLAEYEIIEDDIADLSHFKEENARLKKEIEAIKRGGPDLVDQFAAAAGGGAAPDTQVVGGGAAAAGTTIVVDGDAAAKSGPAGTATPPAEPDAGSDAKILDAKAGKKAEASLEDVVAQAQATAKNVPDMVRAEKPGADGETLEFGPDGDMTKTVPGTGAVRSEAPAVPSAPAATAVVAATQAAAAPTTASGEPPKPTNIFAEFEGAGSSPEEGKDPLAELGEIDTNRMLEELKDLNMDMSVGAEALEEAPDIDKMANEAQNLGKKG